MQRGTARAAQVAGWLVSAFVLLTTWSSLPLGPTPASVAALAVGVLVVVAVAVVRPRNGAGLAPALAGRRALRRDRLAPCVASWQCDPDAAGHARPRAPGRG